MVHIIAIILLFVYGVVLGIFLGIYFSWKAIEKLVRDGKLKWLRP